MRVIVWDQNTDNILLIPEGKRVPEGNFVYGTLHDEAHPPVATLDVDSFDAPVSPQYFSRLLNAQYGIEVAIDDILQESDGEIRMSAVYGRKIASDGVLNQAWQAAVEWLSDLGWGDYEEIDWDNLPKKKIFNQVMKNYDGGWAGFLHAEGLPATPDMMDMLRNDMNQEAYEQATAKPVRDNSDMYENGRLKWANILDPIHETLDQRVFNGTAPRLDIFGDHLHHIKEILRQSNFDPSAFDFFLTGSLCTYQYSETSDVDISITTKHQFSDEDRAELISIMINSLDGERFPGTNYKYQHFVQPEGVDIHDLFAIGIRAGYDFQKEDWIVKPDRTKAKDMHEGHPDWIAQAILISDKLNSLLDGNQQQAAIEMYKDLHSQRREDQRLYGDESLGNIVYKFLNNNGTFERLRYAGQHIASVNILEDILSQWDNFIYENPSLDFNTLFNNFNLDDRLTYNSNISKDRLPEMIDWLNRNYGDIIQKPYNGRPPIEDMRWTEAWDKDAPGFFFYASMSAIMKNEWDKIASRQQPKSPLKWVTEDDFRTSHWKKDWRAAILIPKRNGEGHHFVVADDDKTTHPQLRSKYMLKGQKAQDDDYTNYWRGLYHPQTGTLAHMSSPEEYNDDFGIKDEPLEEVNNSQDFDWGNVWGEESPEGGFYEVAPTGYQFDPNHEKVWRGASNPYNHPINKFKTVTTQDPGMANFESDDNDLMFLDPSEGAGRFMQQAPHLMRTVRNAPNYWDPEAPPSWTRLYSAWRNPELDQYMNIFDSTEYTHLNANGRPCNCGFGAPKSKVKKPALNWKSITSSWQILAATPEEVIQLIAENDLKEGSKWDKRFPGARERLLERLEYIKADPSLVENTQWAWRHLISIAKKKIQELVQPLIDEKWRQDQQKEDKDPNSDDIFDKIRKYQIELTKFTQKVSEGLKQVRGFDNRIKFMSWQMSAIAPSLIQKYSSLEEEVKAALHDNAIMNEADPDLFKKLNIIYNFNKTFNALQVASEHNQDYNQDKFDAGEEIEWKGAYQSMRDPLSDLENSLEKLNSEDVTDEKIDLALYNAINLNSNNLYNTILDLNYTKPLIDRYNIPFNMNQMGSFDELRDQLDNIKASVKEREEYRGLLEQVHGKDPDELWEGKVVGSYPLKDGIWTIRRVTAEDAKLEGELMSHCIGNEDQPHIHGLRSGELQAFSVRDPKGIPWATFTMSQDGDVVYECYGRHDHKVRTAWDKAKDAGLSGEDARNYVDKHPLEQELISQFVHENFGEDHPFLNIEPGERSGALEDTPRYEEDYDEEREPYQDDMDHPLQNAIGDAPYIRSASDLTEYPDWLSYALRNGLKNYLEPGSFEGYSNEVDYDDDGNPYYTVYGDYQIYDYVPVESLAESIINETKNLDMSDEDERHEIANQVIGLEIHQRMVAIYRNNRNPLPNLFEKFVNSNIPQMQWLGNIGSYLHTMDLDDLADLDGETLERDLFGDNLPGDDPNYVPSVWQEEPTSQIQQGQNTLRPENYNALIQALQPYTTKIDTDLHSPIRLSENTLNMIQNYLAYEKDPNIQTVLQTVIRNNYSNNPDSMLTPTAIKIIIRSLENHKNEIQQQLNAPIQGQETMFVPTMSDQRWYDYSGGTIPSLTSKWKLSYFEGYNVNTSHNRMQVSDPKTGEPVAHVTWHPWEDGHLVEYLGYSGDNGEHLHPKRDADIVNDKKQRYPGLARDLLKWTRDNVPGPYYAGFANQRLREMLKGEPTGQSFHISPEYAEELGEPSTEISIDRIKRSKWKLALNGNNAWNPGSEIQTLDDENPFQDRAKKPKWQPEKWRREPEEIDEQSEALDSPSVEKWLKSSGRKDDGVIFTLEPQNPERLAIEGGEPADILHLTLVYLGDKKDFTDEQIDELKKIGSDFATYQDSLNGKITSMAEFPSSSAPAQVALVSAVGLNELRAFLARKIRECGFQFEEKYGFIPHITLAYQDEPVEMPEASLVFDKLVLRVADKPYDFYFEDEVGEDRIDEGMKDESEEHPSFDMKDIQTIVEDHLELDPAYYNKESAVDWSSSPFAYHNTKPENIPAILEQGLVPWNQREQQSNWEKRKALQPVTDRVYLRNQNFPNYKGKGIWSPNHAPLQIDLSKLDPGNLRADEDYAAMLSDREMAEMLGDPELVKMFRQREKEIGNRGRWYEDVESQLGTANPFDQRSFDTGSFTHHGIVPPEAISINPNYRGKLGSWKVAMPPADRVEEFAKDYEAAPVGKRPKWMPKQDVLEGKNWTLDPDAVEKLYHMKDFPLKRYKKIKLDTDPENAGFYNGNGVWINPDQDYEDANHTLWHELQHGYQDEEGRLEQTNHLSDEEHSKHPVELDANQFADYMQRYPLLKRKSNWDDNVWYHVTRKENLQQIRDHGLAPRASMGQNKNFWLPVGDKVVYLHASAEAAAAYASQHSPLLENTGSDPQDMALLRIRNVDKRRLLPDQEAFSQYADRYLESIYNNYHYEYDNNLLKPHLEQYRLNSEENNDFQNSLDFLMSVPTSQRENLIENWSKENPTEAVMYLGTIPAQNIDIMGPAFQNDFGIDRQNYEFTDMYSDPADYLKEQRGESELYPWEDDNDSSKNYFKYQPMFSKWQLAKV